jgi:Family of unknown function (DUF6516)
MLRETRTLLVARERVIFDDGTIIEIKVWRVAEPVPPTRHGLKYSLFYGRPGKRLIGYDNERGKGDHRHYGDREETYQFTSIEQLLDDFQADVERLRGQAI